MPSLHVNMPNRPRHEEVFVPGLVGSFKNGESYKDVEVVPGYTFPNKIIVGVDPDAKEPTAEPFETGFDPAFPHVAAVEADPTLAPQAETKAAPKEEVK